MLKSTDNNAAAKTLVVGLGKTGYSCAQFLSRKKTAFRLVDSRELPPMIEQYLENWSQDSIQLGKFELDALIGIENVIVSPGVSCKEPLVQAAMQRGLNVMSDIELFSQHADAPIVAITGSNGKSTVTTLFGEMIRASGLDVKVGGNLGTPALDLLTGEAPDYYVLEVSSFHLDLTQYLLASAAVVLNISQDHLDRYDSFQEYVASKRKIYDHAVVGVINKDDHAILKMQDRVPRAIYFTEHEPDAGEFGLVEHGDQLWLALGSEPLLSVNELKIKGKHNYINVLACLALGQAIDLSMEDMLLAAKAFAGLPHRCQWIANIHNVDWFNDSKATNVGAAVAAIGSMPNKIILIAGGDSKGADFSEFGKVVAKHARGVVLLGRDAALIAKHISSEVEIKYVKSIEAAVLAAAGLAQEGDSVLLAPGCSSLDMFVNYEERGNLYTAAVRKLAHEGRV